MSAKVIRDGTQTPQRYLFWCPGCHCGHSFSTTPENNGAVWTWNEDYEKPTVSPSIHYPDPPVCHFFIRDGQIQFLGDCAHELAGQTVPMTPWEDS